MTKPKPKRRPRFKVGQVVGIRHLPSRIGKVIRVLPVTCGPFKGRSFGYQVEICNAGTFGWAERDLRPLTKLERGQ